MDTSQHGLNGKDYSFSMATRFRFLMVSTVATTGEKSRR